VSGDPVGTDVEHLLWLGDDALIAAQRLAEWCAAAPELEEDVAMANIALDQLGAARMLLSYAGEAEGRGRDEDDLAYLRDDRDFRNCLLVELPNGDFAMTTAKLFFLSAYQLARYDRLAGGPDPRLAGIAGKTRKESAYHLDHAAHWVLRLGDGTAESHRRMQAAVDAVWPYTHELFEADAALRRDWLAVVEPVLADATLTRPVDGPAHTGGRTGEHTAHLAPLLAEMQQLHRAHPGVTW
jgi:ring-1,2-phenylacetyl-CoA epoxidase subunit PaaC